MTRLGDIGPGDAVQKTGHTAGLTRGVCSAALAMTWAGGSITAEVAVVAATTPGRSVLSPFADCGDSGSLVVRQGASNTEFDAVGIVVGKNEGDSPRWVAVTPMTAVLKDIFKALGEEVTRAAVSSS